MTGPILIGIASYGSPDKLAATVESIQRHSVLDYRILIVDNPHPSGTFALPSNAFITSVRLATNRGYAGAVNTIAITAAQRGAEFFIYCDNDVEIRTPGWDEKLIGVLEHNSDCAQVFPGAGNFYYHNGRYQECLWNAGYCWAIRARAAHGIGAGGLMAGYLGHHEEVDVMIRLRLAGWNIGACPEVQVIHHETSTQSEASAKRIHAGVVRWMNKWNRYFLGDLISYPDPEKSAEAGPGDKIPWSAETHYDPRALRFTDWPPCALYLERWALAQFPGLNANPEVVQTSAGEMDLIRVLKPKGYYRDRAI